MYEVTWSFDFLDNIVSGQGRFLRLNEAKKYKEKIESLLQMEYEFEIRLVKVTRETIHV